MVRKRDLYVAKYPTGLDDMLKHFEDTVLLQRLGQSKEPRVLGIVGLGGAGKTTLAKEFFNRKNSDYETSCFLFDVRYHAAKGSLNVLQRKLLNSLTGLDQPVDSVDEGKGMLIDPLKSSNALVILDDVDDVNQVDALLPLQIHDLRPGTLILITSRDKHVLRSSTVEKTSIYRLTGLNPERSRELFCSHAFSQPYPLPGFGYLVDRFLEACNELSLLEVCNGLPISLKVYGTLLYGRDISDWEDEIGSLKHTLPNEIKQTFMRSYNSLTAEEKEIFLDIACFFIGQNRDTAIRIWDGSGWKGRLGFQNLEDKSLVEVDSLNNIRMHKQIRDIGRDIAEDSRLPRRLWRWTEKVIDDFSSLSSNEQIRTVRGVKMVLHEYYDDELYGAIVMRRLQLLDTEGVLLDGVLKRVEFPNLLWLSWNVCPSSSLPSLIPMKNLRVLQVSGSKLKTLWQDESQAPLQLRELEISAPLLNIPKSIEQLKNLERIMVDGLGGAQMTKLPEEICHLQSLRALVLRNCYEIISLPDCFGHLSNLQHMELHHCPKLKSIPNSFGNLTKLTYLDLCCCKGLTIGSETLGKINTLEYINLYQCEKIKILPQQVVCQRSLVTLQLKGTVFKELPSEIGELHNLEVLGIGSPSLDRLPCSLGNLKNLKYLSILYCKELKCLPASLGRLSQLTKLEVFGYPLRGFIFEKDIEGNTWPRLQKLSLIDTKISEVPFTEGVCPNLEKLCISQCNDLVKVGTLPNTLTELDFFWCSNLRKIKGLLGLAKLRRLVVDGCPKVESLPSMETFISLENLRISGCVKQRSILGLAQLTKLMSFDVYNCGELEELEGVEHCMLLKELYISGCPKLRWGEGILKQVCQQVQEVKFF